MLNDPLSKWRQEGKVAETVGSGFRLSCFPAQLVIIYSIVGYSSSEFILFGGAVGVWCEHASRIQREEDAESCLVAMLPAEHV